MIITNWIIAALMLFCVVALVIIADLEASLEDSPDHEALEPRKDTTA
jgi:hypothetical protein